MNITRLNTLNDDKVIIRGNGGNGGGSGSNYKYYDCSKDTPNDNGELPHGIYLADSMKIINIVTGEIMIAPEANFDDGDYKVLAVAYDMSKRIYINREWIDAKTFLELQEGFDFSAHQEITEEEFYRLPKSYGIINVNFGSNGEEFKDFFEDAWSYLTAHAPAETYIPFIPYPVEYLKIVYPAGDYYEYGSKALNASWDTYESDEGYWQNIVLDNYAGNFKKITHSDGTIEYMFEFLS